MKEYAINGRAFVQRPLVLGQLQQLLCVLDGVTLPDPITLASLLDALGGRLYSAIAIVITEKGGSPRDKDVGALAAELEWSVQPETAMEIIDDFFVMNPVSSIIERIGALIGRFNAAAAPRAGGSTRRSSSSPGATSPGATGSSGGSR